MCTNFLFVCWFYRHFKEGRQHIYTYYLRCIPEWQDDDDAISSFIRMWFVKYFNISVCIVIIIFFLILFDFFFFVLFHLHKYHVMHRIKEERGRANGLHTPNADHIYIPAYIDIKAYAYVRSNSCTVCACVWCIPVNSSHCCVFFFNLFSCLSSYLLVAQTRTHTIFFRLTFCLFSNRHRPIVDIVIIIPCTKCLTQDQAYAIIQPLFISRVCWCVWESGWNICMCVLFDFFRHIFVLVNIVVGFFFFFSFFRNSWRFSSCVVAFFYCLPSKPLLFASLNESFYTNTYMPAAATAADRLKRKREKDRGTPFTSILNIYVGMTENECDFYWNL